jgi:hypothetical protein
MTTSTNVLIRFYLLQNERDGYVNIEALGANERNQFR